MEIPKQIVSQVAEYFDHVTVRTTLGAVCRSWNEACGSAQKVWLSVDLKKNITEIIKKSPSYILASNSRDDINKKNMEFSRLLEEQQDRPIREGVAWTFQTCRESFLSELNLLVDDFAARRPVDYHPNSQDIVRDHVHPALFSFIHGVSPFNPSAEMPSAPQPPVQGLDMWGRPFEDSKFQWLPTYFDIPSDLGSVKARDYINNMTPREDYAPLYAHLESLFGSFVPMLEGVLGYAEFIRSQFLVGEVEENFYEDPGNPKDKDLQRLIQPMSLGGKRLQVITKIVDYELEPGQSYEGVWHVEGMSHERIAATCLLVLDRGDCIEGGDILFKRAITKLEAELMYWKIDQLRVEAANKFLKEPLIPLGKVSTDRGKMIVFPNSHVHRVTKMTNTGTEKARRRIVVFFIVDPNHRIVSTQEVPDQSLAHFFSRDQALEYRLELMKERKFHKQDWNVREIELCEH